MPATPLAVALLGRAPSSPDAKTRLRSALAPASVRGLAAALLLDTLDAVRRTAGADPVIVATPPSAVAELRRLAPDVRHVIAQRGADLGARMHHAFVDLFALGYQRVILVGTDLPTLPSAHLSAADERLTMNAGRVVLGPAEDGGYYLIGLARPEPGLFEGITWGTPDVFVQTQAAAARTGRAIVEVPAWHDVDTVGDLQRLAAELASLPPDAAVHTRAWMREVLKS